MCWFNRAPHIVDPWAMNMMFAWSRLTTSRAAIKYQQNLVYWEEIKKENTKESHMETENLVTFDGSRGPHGYITMCHITCFIQDIFLLLEKKCFIQDMLCINKVGAVPFRTAGTR